MSKSQILSDDKRHLAIFENGVAINKSLPKWRNVEKHNATLPDRDKIKFSNVNSYRITDFDGEGIENNDPDRYITPSSLTDIYKIPQNTVDSFSKIATMGIKELNRLIVEKKVKYVMAGYGSFGTTVTLSTYVDNDSTEKGSGSSRKFDFKSFFRKKNAVKENPPIDALNFFSLIKATSKESAMEYKNRIEPYLAALHKAINIGQTALSEELLKNLITNKYEAQLYAEGYYYAVTEKQVVEFLKKTEKGIRLSYISNFSRPIPDEIAEKIATLNELEIFDNYVVLYYDPDGEIFKETAEENAKRRDPILFGLIAGSRKLYYVGDWIDDYCDLTLDEFVDTLKIDKEELVINNVEK